MPPFIDPKVIVADVFVTLQQRNGVASLGNFVAPATVEQVGQWLDAKVQAALAEANQAGA